MDYSYDKLLTEKYKHLLNPMKKPIVTEISLKELNGEWIGRYRGHVEQVVRFVVSGTLLIATKITGDDHVPGGEVTFKADLENQGRGLGQVAEQEFRNSTWVPGRLVIIDQEHVQFTWENCGTVEYRKDD